MVARVSTYECSAPVVGAYEKRWTAGEVGGRPLDRIKEVHHRRIHLQHVSIGESDRARTWLLTSRRLLTDTNPTLILKWYSART